MASSTLNFLDGGGTTAELIRAFPWSATELGPIETWPSGLKTVVGVLLRSPVPIVTLWGLDGYMIYNDAYSVFAGGRHPQLLGSKVREGWPEVASFNDNVMKVVMTGQTLSYVEQELTLHRSGKPEPVWMNLDYSPITYENGDIAGVIAVVIEMTAKVKAERHIQGERARLSAMFEQAPGFMALLTGPEHHFDLANSAFQELIGNRHWNAQRARDVLPELDQQGYFDILDEAYGTGVAITGQATPFQLDQADGAPGPLRYLDFVYQPLKDPNGEVFGIFVEGSDVTERVRAESALRESEAKFRAFAQAMPHHVWTAPANGQLDWFNDRVYEYTGVAEGRLDGDSWGDMVHPDDIEFVGQRWNESVLTGALYEVEFRIRRHDGVYRWYLVRAMPMRDQAGQVVRWIGSNTDIEEQKTTSQALVHLNATLEEQVSVRTAERDRIWRLSKDIMLVADLNSQLSAVNPAFTSTLGWREGDVIGTSFLDLVHPDDVQPTIEQISSLTSGAHVFRFQNRYRRKDGSYCTLSWTAVPDTNFIHAIGRDISADLQQAEAMRRTEAALQQAQKMETIGKLTGGVAHDFNNLLQVISGNLQLMAQDVCDMPLVHRRVENALASVERGAKLASSLLSFARKQPLEPKVVKVSRLIMGMEDMLRRSLGEEIEMETVVSGGLWSTAVDVAQLENAILNLAINARDAMDGRGRLTIEVNNALLDTAYCASHPDVAPGQYVAIAVSDTGSGMSPEVLRQAFEPFFSTKAEGKGTGLGLSMVYGLVKQSGGHIKIYSELGEGTTIKLYLPRSLETEDTYASLETQPVIGGSETVLVVEDDDAVRATAVDMLTTLGYRVLKANHATAALTVIDSGIHVDLLFTDVVMPGPLRSPEMARKAKERLPGLAVLFTSGYTENAIVHGGRLDRGVELIGKPYTKESLARKIRHVLANEQQRQAEKPQHVQPDTQVQTSRAKLKVLLVEDDQDIRENTRDMIQFLGYDVMAVGTAEDAMEHLTLDIDILVSDLQLPGIQGDDLIQLAKARVPHLRVLLASGLGSANLPGVDALPKPYSLDTLRTKLLGAHNLSNQGA
ncbi:PAS domain S-box protein [Massilia sp. Mn16-1_5]|uniref:PAS domain S-box protein n=1 Tax=Massilia sp. Mn16-1_5 TaxID=2079199 RepID=UPI00109E8A26|nr:PAS domain S-box protein [Massilia sp. Mn16-1_5]THC40636.1 hybrid sensor histidine kinase/response regulator [Massilia sp. Mn16-1_5]